MHGTRDLFLLLEYAVTADEAARGPQQLTWIDTHNHIALYDQDPYVTQAAETVLEWLGRQLRR